MTQTQIAQIKKIWKNNPEILQVNNADLFYNIPSKKVLVAQWISKFYLATFVTCGITNFLFLLFLNLI